MTRRQQVPRHWFYLLFAVSGFSGLIYESIWSHYLKLFLGHAAYAQTLVLAIFMGGMAIGAWIPSRYGVQRKNLLQVYAIVEAIIGLCAIVFHKVFVNATDVAYDHLIPALGSPWSVNLLKWSLGSVLILPQSILLGMTFPMMSASVIRRHPAQSGTALAMLYFSNSFGAAVGVLVGGFFLIDMVGLPGTVLTAGLINIFVALVAWHFSRVAQETLPKRTSRTANHDTGSGSWRLLIVVSFLTGTASFIYEIGWIRMLSLVLGSSTHSFELMLSAFIFGLAFGGIWMRRRIDLLSQPVMYLGWVQIVMGLLALATLSAYNASFDTMQLLIRSLTTTDSGYFLFNLGSHGIALLIMVPVTFCAGMTLPLITHTLLRGGHGEKSIGIVYAANTAGAIAGIFFAVHVGLTTLGLKGLISAGAALDMILGIVLLATSVKLHHRRVALAALLVAVTVLLAVLGGIEFDRYKMASGVYRHGQFFSPDKSEILYHKDGKTATVDLIKDLHGQGLTISTNGKADARIILDVHEPPSGDEHTMTLAGVLPLLYHPQARTAAIIGMGSGLTTHVLLDGTGLERVDTVEIEPAMIEAAQGFRPRVEAPFSDPRSHFHIDDAKTYFSANQSRYDIIVSEPSNPWVSGVAGLYTDEFYRRARTHLNPGGIFLQWIHVYEMDFNLVASVMKAIGRNFADYTLFAANDADLLIVAAVDGELPSLGKLDLSEETLRQALRRIDINTSHELELRYIGERALLEPLFASTPVPVNSDYFPYLDLHAVRARFMKNHVMELTLMRGEKIPALELLSGEKNPVSKSSTAYTRHFSLSRHAHAAAILRDYYAGGTMNENPNLDLDLFRHATVTRQLERNCRGRAATELWLESAYEILNAAIPYSGKSEMNALWRRLRASDCYRRLSPVNKNMFTLLGAVGRRDAPRMATLAEMLLQGNEVPENQHGYLLAAGMIGQLANKNPEAALELWKTYAPRVMGSRQPGLLLRLLWSHSVYRSQIKSQQKIVFGAKGIR